MKCQDRDPALLLFGLGNLPRWECWVTARHLHRCARCRTRQRELATLAGRIGAALRLPGDRSDSSIGERIPARLYLAPRLLRSLLLALIFSLLCLYCVGHRNTRRQGRADLTVPAGACRPDLPNDRCR